MNTGHDRPKDDAGYGYFVLHAHAVQLEGRRSVRLTLEDLTTGRKDVFGSTAELGRFLDEWGGVASGGGNERFRPTTDRGTA
ncbi:MAG: hypothetical protein U0132_22065 [Gemmatimonadaceae bacterium]